MSRVCCAITVCSCVMLLPGATVYAAIAADVGQQPIAAQDIATLERQFHHLPVEARRHTGPLFWLHGDESQGRLERYVGKVAEGGNGCFTTESRPHRDWLGPGWFRDLGICLKAAKQHNLQMWIFDEKWWPSQGVGGKVPPRYAAKRLTATAVTVDGPRAFEGEGFSGPHYIAAVAGRVAADGKIEGESLVDLGPHIRDGKLAWQVPPGKWRVMKFTHVQAPALSQNGQLSVDGASRDCVEWFIRTVYQPHYDHFAADFGKTIRGFFYDEPETRGNWGSELNAVLAERNVDWKNAYVAHEFGLSGPEQAAAKYQYLDVFAEAWGRTMYGGITCWCHQHGVKSMGHFMEHGGLYHNLNYCAGNMMALQGHSDLGAIDAVFDQFVMGKRVARDPPTWQTPKLASSVSHAFGKPDDVAMVEIFGARGQSLTYSEMKWWADHMQVSGVNFLIPHSFNPRSPFDTDCPPYFYNGGFEPRWPLYRVFADYTSRLSLMLTGGRHVCPVALLFMGQSVNVGRVIGPEDMTTALQDAQLDCDWLPYNVFERDARVAGKELRLHGEHYSVLVVPPVEVIPQATLAKAKEFFEAGGVVVGYGFLPSQSATFGHSPQEIASLCEAIWGGNPAAGPACCRSSPAGGRSYLLPEKPTPAEVQAALADAGVHPGLEVLAGETSGWLHVLHRVKAGQDVFLICNQNHTGAARRFKFRATAAGQPECWDAMRNEITAVPFERTSSQQVEFSLTLEPLESVLVVFRAKGQSRPPRIEGHGKPIHEPMLLVRDPNPPRATAAEIAAAMKNDALKRHLDPRHRTLSPIAAADPFRAHFAIPAAVDLAKTRVCLEMDDLPDQAAAVRVNGVYAGGVIGRPLRLDISRQLTKGGGNSIVIEPRAPKSAQLQFYPRGGAE